MIKLFSSFKIKDLELKNRIVMAPMCMNCADRHGYVTNFHVIHYVTRAIGGVGLIILEATGVEAGGRITEKDLGIWEEGHIRGLKKIVRKCHKSGAKIGIQLNHGGRKAEIIQYKAIAPSAIPFNEKYRVPEEMTKEEIHRVIFSFRDAARRALEAGFDLIELHAAHGYLIGQFLSPLTNRREDEYGGTIENRGRFLKELLEEVKKVWPENKPLLVRVSAEEYAEGGNHPEEIVQLIQLLKQYGIDIVNVSSGGVVPAKIDAYPGYQVTYSEIVRRQCKIPTIAGGLITLPYMAEEILSNHRADLVYLGRELLSNPYWPLQAAKSLNVDIEWPVQYQRSRTIQEGGF